MAEVKNAFLKSKMNKDLDSRLVPAGEYRDAVNVQINKSEGEDVGALENVQGNGEALFDFASALGVSSIFCVGHVVDNLNNIVYLFFTTNELSGYNTSATNAIYSYSNNSSTATLLVGGTANGKFLNFSTQSPITGVNLVESLLFFTDNRNQPRKINIDKASNDSTYYTTEDQISVAKYNPYQSIEVFRASEQAGAVFSSSGTPFTTTVSSDITSTITIPVASVGALTPGLAVQGTGVKEQTVITEVGTTDITVNRSQTLTSGTTLSFVRLETTMYDVVNSTLPDGTTANPYYDANFPGDPRFLEDKFVRFSYRFKFDDGEYSILAPFTQGCFIPQQDGCFLEGDEEQTFASTLVGFAENKVNKIDLFIPLPDAGNNIVNSYKIKELDIVYKESDALAVQVVETLTVDEVSTEAGADDYFVYSYVSTKPYKTLPDSELIRVYDKVPVKALSQEVAGNRVIYGNFQDKHTPPVSINYQVGVSQKLDVSENSSSFGSVEYPSSSVKENRNYQVGVVLSDKFGRQSTVVLSNNTQDATGAGFGADTVYLPYRKENTDTEAWEWLGNSLKIQFNELLSGPSIDQDTSTGTPGLYNSDPTDPNYNPLGWYSYKIVVKQIEQDYYNVYTAGAMKDIPYDYNTASPPSIGNEISPNTSFTTLINDNINKVPRDLSEVGPQDKSFRSSVVLFGRVNNNTNVFSNIGNEQYLPTNNKVSFTTNNIEDLFDLFDVSQFKDPVDQNIFITNSSSPFYSFFKADSSPFIAEFVTSQDANFQFGVLNQSNTSPKGDATVSGTPFNSTSALLVITTPGLEISPGDLVTASSGIVADTYVINYDSTTGVVTFNKAQTSLNSGTVLTFSTSQYLKIENLAVLETAPTVSRLDIFWETSTSGLISDLNIEISAGTGLVSEVVDFSYSHLESYSPGAQLIQNTPGTPHVNEFYFIDVLGNIVDPGAGNVELTVVDGAGDIITNKFTLTQSTDTRYFSLQQSSGSYFYYEGPLLGVTNPKNIFLFTFKVTVGSSESFVSPPVSVDTSLTNVAPVIDPKSLSYVNYRQTTIVSWAANDNTNGSADSTKDNKDITYSLVGAPAQFSLQTYPSTSTDGKVDIIQDIASYNTFGTFNFTLRATDAGGAITDTALSFSIAQPNTPSYFEAITRTLGQGDGSSELFINGPTAPDPGNGIANLPLSTAIPSGDQIGYQPPVTSLLNFTTNREVSNPLCSGGSNNTAEWKQRIQGTPATNSNVGAYPYTGVNSGSIFFVWVQLSEQQNNQESQVYAAIESREVSNSSWNIATDVFGNDCYFSNEYKWEQNSGGTIVSEGMINEPFGTPSSNINNRRLFVESSVPSGTPSPFISSQGGRVFALNGESLPKGTEYRITIGNVSNNYNAFLNSGGPVCADFNDFKTNVIYMVDDFINPTLLPFVTPSGGNIYQYEITTFGTSSTPCSGTFIASSTYYSASPFARYLFAPTPGVASDQIFDLFTNVNLTTKVTYPSAGSPRYARIRKTGSFGVAGDNPENTKDGSYILKVDGSGIPEILGPCLY